MQSQVLTTKKKVTTTVERELVDGERDRTQHIKEMVEVQQREFDEELGEVHNKYVCPLVSLVISVIY